MTPHEINVLLHIHAIAEPFKPDSPAYEEAIESFTINGMIYKTDSSGSGYKTTKFGDAMVNMLCETPLTVPADPRKQRGVEGENKE